MTKLTYFVVILWVIAATIIMTFDSWTLQRCVEHHSIDTCYELLN